MIDEIAHQSIVTVSAKEHVMAAPTGEIIIASIPIQCVVAEGVGKRHAAIRPSTPNECLMKKSTHPHSHPCS